MAGILSIIGASLLPFLYLFTQVQILGGFTHTFANISGFIGGMFFLWEFVLGIKVFAKKLNLNSPQFIKLHIILGVWGMFFVLIHPILEMFSYAEKITFLFLPNLSSSFAIHVTFGKIALILILLLWTTSTLVRQKVTYKQWLNFHYLSYPLMFFVFWHTLDIGTFLGTFILIKIYWFSLAALYTGLVIWRISVAVGGGNKVNSNSISK